MLQLHFTPGTVVIGMIYFTVFSTKETKAYQPIPIITNFIDVNGVDRMEEEINANYTQIKLDVQGIVEEELKRLSTNKD